MPLPVGLPVAVRLCQWAWGCPRESKWDSACVGEVEREELGVGEGVGVGLGVALGVGAALAVPVSRAEAVGVGVPTSAAAVAVGPPIPLWGEGVVGRVGAPEAVPPTATTGPPGEGVPGCESAGVPVALGVSVPKVLVGVAAGGVAEGLPVPPPPTPPPPPPPAAAGEGVCDPVGWGGEEEGEAEGFEDPVGHSRAPVGVPSGVACEEAVLAALAALAEGEAAAVHRGVGVEGRPGVGMGVPLLCAPPGEGEGVEDVEGEGEGEGVAGWEVEGAGRASAARGGGFRALRWATTTTTTTTAAAASATGTAGGAAVGCGWLQRRQPWGRGWGMQWRCRQRGQQQRAPWWAWLSPPLLLLLAPAWALRRA